MYALSYPSPSGFTDILPALRPDPALQRYYDMNKNRWKYFRWTPRAAWIGFMYAVFVPSVMGYAFWRTDVRLDPF